MSYYESSDYCGCTLGDISFYYGYEVEEDGEWCFTATKNNKEIARYKFSQISNQKNMFENMIDILLGGINIMIYIGLLEINLRGKTQ